VTRRHLASLLPAAFLAAPTGFFRLTQAAGRTWLADPQGRLFFSVGLNHIDPSPLRFAERGRLWQERYRNSNEIWLKTKVRPDLVKWGFNSVGWVQEMASNGITDHKQSRNFIFEEYQWLGLPYCHMLPFADFHHWNAQTRLPDFFSTEWADWCDYVAREDCARMRDDPKLIGYFLVDCPVWVHTHPHSRWRGPIFDFKRLDTEDGRRELHRLATRYYQTTHDAIRRYDPNHLILGDRYEGRGRMAAEVLHAAKPFVDVLCFQYFGEPARTRADLERWSTEIGKPVLLADAGIGRKPGDGTAHHDPAEYEALMTGMRELPTCIGFHLCGGYLRNRIRKKGLLLEDETPDRQALDGITRINRQTLTWVQQQQRQA
jgi:hypothetical protein